MIDAYDDILNLPHHVSKKHPHMAISDRAAQFSPFAALTGYGEAVKETARITESYKELDENEKEILSENLRLAAEQIGENRKVTITFFRPDEKKEGGIYLTMTGYIKKIDEYERIICMTDGTKVAIDQISSLQSD